MTGRLQRLRDAEPSGTGVGQRLSQRLLNALEGSNSDDSQVVRPLLHEYPSAVEQIGPRIDLFQSAAELVRQGRFADRSWSTCLLHRPRLEAGPHAVYGRPVVEAGDLEDLGQRHVR